MSRPRGRSTGNIHNVQSFARAKAECEELANEPRTPRVPPGATLTLRTDTTVLHCVQAIEWQTQKPIPDTWVLPGGQVLTTDEIRSLAASRGWGAPEVNDQKGN